MEKLPFTLRHRGTGGNLRLWKKSNPVPRPKMERDNERSEKIGSTICNKVKGHVGRPLSNTILAYVANVKYISSYTVRIFVMDKFVIRFSQ